MIGAAELARMLELPAPTDEQAAVIEAPLEPLLVVAGAGSGKTETMAARVLFLVVNGIVTADQILGLTFTRKAAAGLATRIRRRLRTMRLAGGGPVAEDAAEPEVWTYHGFGGRLISEFGPLAGIEPGARLLSPTGAWQLARRVVGRWDGDLRTDLRPEQVTEHLLAVAGGLADHLRDAPALSGVTEDLVRAIRSAPPGPRQAGVLRKDLVDHSRRMADRAAILPLVDAFAAAKRSAGVIDFADQMRLAADLTDLAPQVGAAVRDRYRVVLLDEYQDTGHAQRVILTNLFGARIDDRDNPWADGGTRSKDVGHPVVAVGDPVQTIYSWRGASASNLPRFVTDFPRRGGGPAATLHLSTSFRNDRSILAVANAGSADVRAAGAPVPALRPRPDADDGTVEVGLFTTVTEELEWMAAEIADRWHEAERDGRQPPTTAVLVRRRRDMDGVAEALRAQGLPVEVVGLGGLLSEPEIADMVALLRVLVDPGAGDAAVRLLTGARWRFGLADLLALGRRAQELAAGSDRPDPASGHPGDSSTVEAALRQQLAKAALGADLDGACLVEAITDPGPLGAYSVVGARRLTRLAEELTRLRARMWVPLPDLIAELERVTCLDIEVAIRPGGRVHLDAFADVVADVAATGAGPNDLIDYLMTAAEREDGLAPGEVPAPSDRVQVLTVHAAKGLEWEVVAVPHVSESVFPSQQARSWLTDPTQLPPAIRGDRADLPRLTLPPVGSDQRELSQALTTHVDELKSLGQVEERRLFYVAVTRAERVLLLSGHHFGGTAVKPHGASVFLREAAAIEPGPPGLRIVYWSPPPPDGATNPLAAQPRQGQWPTDPLGSRRPALQEAADRVLSALPQHSGGTEPNTLDGDQLLPEVERGPTALPSEVGRSWRQDAAVLLAERARSHARRVEVEIPTGLTVTGLVELAADPAAAVRRRVRPLPRSRDQNTLRGSAFHRWLEARWSGEPLLDLRELPGASDAEVEATAGADLEELTAAFLRSPWADRTPVEVELPFVTAVDGLPLRGRIDAVFRDPDGGVTVVDWKTGAPPASEDAAAAAAVQLAVYRLAAAELLSVPVESVRAVFVHVARGLHLRPVDGLTRDELVDTISRVTSRLSGVPARPGVRAPADGSDQMARSSS